MTDREQRARLTCSPHIHHFDRVKIRYEVGTGRDQFAQIVADESVTLWPSTGGHATIAATLIRLAAAAVDHLDDEGQATLLAAVEGLHNRIGLPVDEPVPYLPADLPPPSDAVEELAELRRRIDTLTAERDDALARLDHQGATL